MGNLITIRYIKKRSGKPTDRTNPYPLRWPTECNHVWRPCARICQTVGARIRETEVTFQDFKIHKHSSRLWQIVSACFEVHTTTHNLCDIVLRTNPVRVYCVYRIIGNDDAGRAFKTGSCFTTSACEKEVLLLTITTLMRQSL